jgi:hypothetical protein
MCPRKLARSILDGKITAWEILAWRIVVLMLFRKFVVRKAVRVLVFYVLRDAVYAYTAASPYGSWADIAHIKPIVSFADQPFMTRWSWAWVQIFLTYVALEQANAAYGVVSVATGLANPRDCPSAFGDLRGLVTVRNAWS